MKKIYLLVFLVFCSLGLDAQNKKYESEDLGFLEHDASIRKSFTFYELLEKSIRYKEANRQDEFEYNGISYRGDIICSFSELLFDPATHNSPDAGVRYYSEAIVRYYFKNTQLIYKTIDRNGAPITYLYFDPNGKLISYKDYLMLDDSEPKAAHCFFDYPIPYINPHKNKIKSHQLLKIKNDIRKILSDQDSIKDFADMFSFTLKNFNDFKKINSYLKKELKLEVLKDKEFHFVWMGTNYGIFNLSFRDLNGNYYTISEGKYGGNSIKEIGLLIESEKRDFFTSVDYHANGQIKSIYQKEDTNWNNRLLGQNAEYTPEGSVIREVNLEQAFQLTRKELYKLVENSKICSRDKDFLLDFNDRMYHTNYGNLWSIKLRCFGNQINLFINDTSGEIYQPSDREYYSTEQYKAKYGDEDYRVVEKKINKRIIIYPKLLGEF
ncbi:MAG: hypothetical protein JST78_06550 [Bacteroidetes bacterium]|nr:hypothetical protein [Bacteroidota bacterium]